MACESRVRGLFKSDPSKLRKTMPVSADLYAFYKRQAELSLQLIKAAVAHDMEKPDGL